MDLRFEVDLFLLQLRLEFFDLLERQGVFHSAGHLVGDLLQEVYIRRVVGAGLLTGENQRAQAAARRCERQKAETAHPERLCPLRKLRPTVLLGHVRNDQRVLSLPDDSRRVLFDWQRVRSLGGNGFRGLQDMKGHGVAPRVVQAASEVIEAHHQMESIGEIMEECR